MVAHEILLLIIHGLFYVSRANRIVFSFLISHSPPRHFPGYSYKCNLALLLGVFILTLWLITTQPLSVLHQLLRITAMSENHWHHSSNIHG